jgi:hypothetical protein
MVVEAYEGLAVVVSPAAKLGIIEWHIAPGREAEADILAQALATETGLQPVS